MDFSVRVFDATFVIQGRRDVMAANAYADVTIANGEQGMYRNDIIVRKYEKDEMTEIENTSFDVIKGTPSSGVATDPEIPTGDIRTGATMHNMALYRVKLEGLNIVALEPMFKVLYNMADIKKELESLNGKITEQNTLWDGFLYMQGGQEVKLSTPIDRTKSGIVLVFSFVENEKAQDYAWHSFFVPKALVESRPGDGHQFNLFWNTWSQKYLYIHNDKIVGQPTNSNTQNKRFGLRKIIAV